eukprot:316389-Hanusia_phi.AAC.5
MSDGQSRISREQSSGMLQIDAVDDSAPADGGTSRWLCEFSSLILARLFEVSAWASPHPPPRLVHQPAYCTTIPAGTPNSNFSNFQTFNCSKSLDR